MGLLDRLFGRKLEFDPDQVVVDIPTRDAEAVRRYERMLRTAPTEVIERAHVEAFARLSPAQLDLLYRRMTASASADDERPTAAQPEMLARWAARAERRRPGLITKTLEGVQSRTDMNTFAGAAIIDLVVWYALASTAWHTWQNPDAAAAGGSQSPGDQADDWDFGL